MTITTFAEDILRGLSSEPKYLSSKYFYDKKGDEIFQEIMKMPEYYLTKSEYEVFSIKKNEILQLLTKGNKEFHLIEFGAGDGLKTKVLLDHFLNKNVSFKYSPIDISKNVLDELTDDLETNFSDLEVQPLNNDYFKALDKLERNHGIRKVILFLGSNIGNFTKIQAINFLKKVKSKMSSDDLLMIGFDLKKDPDVVLDAYNDVHGITRAFNLNLLRRINMELGANFDLTAFKHCPTYNPMTGETKSYLVSRKDQEVFIEELNETFKFQAWEAIDMEVSQKFDLSMINELAEASGFIVEENLFDCKHYFTDSIWSVNPSC